jgi:tetratricopeptide (TPR) repeat protein
MRRGWSRLVAVMLVASHAAAAPPAPKDDAARARAEAREHFTAGIQAFERGDYDGAIAEYKQAYDLTHAPALLFNLAQVYRKKGSNDEALDYYRRYLREEPNARNRPDVEERIAEIEGVPAAPVAKPTPPVVETPPVAAPAAPTQAPAPAPEPTVAIPSPPPSPPLDRGGSLRKAGLITMGAGGVLAATSVVLLVSAHSAASTVEDRYRQGGMWTGDDRSTYDRGKLENGLGIGIGIAAGAAVASGAILYYLGARAEKVDLAFVPGAGGGSMVVKCGF